MTPRSVPWLVAAFMQGAAIAWLLFLLLAEPAAAKPTADGPAPTTAQPVVAASGGGPTAGAAAPPAPLSPPSTPSPANDGPTAVASVAPLGTLLHGSVRARDGKRLESVWLSVFVGDAPKPLAETSLNRVSEYAIAGLAPGSYRLTARCQNMRTFEQSFLVPAAATDVCVDIVLTPSWLLKVLLLTPEGKPLHDAVAGDKDLQGLEMFGTVNVIAWGSELPTQLPATDGRETTFTIATWQPASMLRGDGKLPAKYAGQLEMREDRAVVVATTLSDTVLEQVPVQAGQEEVTLVVDPARLRAQLATVRLQVVDAATNQPVPNAKVGLNYSQSFSKLTAADAEGRFERARLRPGSYTLTIDGGDRRIAPMVAVNVAPGAVTDLGQIPVMAPFELRVKVTGLAAEKHAGATLTALESPGPPVLSPGSTRLAVQKDELKTNVWPGRYQLRITDGSSGATLEFDTRRLGGEPLTVVLQPEPALQIDPSHLDEPVRLVLRSATSGVAFDRWITWKVVFPVTLPAGEYRASLHRLRGAPREERLTVPAAGANYELR